MCIMDGTAKKTKEEIHMKKPNVLIGLLQLIGAIILGWILWLFIFAAIIPEAPAPITTTSYFMKCGPPKIRIILPNP